EPEKRSGRRRRSARNCHPSITGIIRSRRIRRGRTAAPSSTSRASRPLAAERTANPSASSSETSPSRVAASSSTTRIVLPCSVIGRLLRLGQTRHLQEQLFAGAFRLLAAVPAQLQLGHDLVGENAQSVALVGGKVAR